MAGKIDAWLTAEGLIRLEGWARDGLTDKQIAKNAGIAESTLRLWKTQHREIFDALKRGKDVPDREVENALFKSAIGYTKTVRKPVKVRTVIYDPTTGKKTQEREEWKAVEEDVHVPPQVTAQIFWLKNRKPEQWRDRQEYTDTTALDKLDAILAENIKHANAKAE